VGGRGRNGTGRPLAQRLLEDGEHVVDVPAKLAARVRLFDTGHNRKTDALDAHSIAVVAVRTEGLRVLTATGSSRRCGCWPTAARAGPAAGADRQPAAAPAQRAHPRQAKKDMSPLQAKKMLASVRPRDIAGKTRRRIAAEQLAELVAVEKPR
jgi:transposase